MYDDRTMKSRNLCKEKMLFKKTLLYDLTWVIRLIKIQLSGIAGNAKKLV